MYRMPSRTVPLNNRALEWLGHFSTSSQTHRLRVPGDETLPSSIRTEHAHIREGHWNSHSTCWSGDSGWAGTLRGPQGCSMEHLRHPLQARVLHISLCCDEHPRIHPLWTFVGFIWPLCPGVEVLGHGIFVYLI